MNKETIKKIRDVAREIPGVVIKVICDNSQNFFDGHPTDHVLIWDDTNERLLCIRQNGTANINMAPQHKVPFEVVMTDYEHIQFIQVFCDLDTVDKILTATSYAKKAQLLEYLKKLPVMRSEITGSTGDGIDWETTSDSTSDSSSGSGTDTSGD